jgi:hypothetical protein
VISTSPLAASVLSEVFYALLFVMPLVVIGMAVYLLIIKPSWRSRNRDVRGFEVKMKERD